MANYDVIIIGGSVPAMTSAAYLAKDANLNVLVLERHKFVGATAMCYEMNVPGHRFSPAATGEYYPNPKVAADLELEKYGLERIEAKPMMTTSFGNGEYISLYHNIEDTANEFARFSQHDAEAYADLMKTWTQLGQVFGMAQMNAPISLSQFIGTMSSSPAMEAMMRDMLFASVRDILDRTFENDYVKAAFLPLCEGADQAPSATPFFFGVGRIMAPWGFVKGGLNSVADAVQKSALAHGVEIRTEANVEKIIVKNGKAVGVICNGEEILADRVITNADTEWTFDNLVDDGLVPDEYIKSLKEMNRSNGGGGTLNLALSELPDFGFPEDRYNGFFSIGTPGYDYYEDAFCAYQKRQIPERLCSMTYMPSYIEPGVFAPEGKHTLTAYVFPYPYDLREGDWESRKDELFEKWIDSLDAFAPGLKKSVIGYDGYTPVELERMFNMKKGDIQHGNFRWISQLNMRPGIGYSNYKTPIENLYTAGNSTWPTSGLTGVNGFILSRTIMKDMGMN